MKNMGKPYGRLLALLLTDLLLLSAFACAPRPPGGTGKTDPNAPVTIEREAAPRACRVASAATVLALRQYIAARLKTEAFVTADFMATPPEELAVIVDEALAAWETAMLLSSGAEAIADRAQSVLEAQKALETASRAQPMSQGVPLAAKRPDSAPPMEADDNTAADPRAWAEHFTKQFDAIEGNQKIKQLAQQLGQDAKAVHEQLMLAQAIIRNEATADAAFWDKMTKAAQVTKTTCKVVLFVGVTVATGGGSLSALAGSSLTAGQAGAVIVSGVDCIVDITSTGSSVFLGENHQVTIRANDLKDQIAPVSAVVGLLTLDTEKTSDLIVYIGDSLSEWFAEGKIMGVKASFDDESGANIEVAPIDAPESEEDVDSTLEEEGFAPQQESGADISGLIEEYGIADEGAATALEALDSEMDEITGEASAQSADTDIQPTPPATKEETPAQPTPAPTEGIDVTGIYDFTGTITVYDTTDALEPRTATVKRSGSGMTIAFSNESGTVLTGTYDDSTATFIGRDLSRPEDVWGASAWQMTDTTIHFSISNGAVTAEGYLDTGVMELVNTSSVIEFTLTKIS